MSGNRICASYSLDAKLPMSTDLPGRPLSLHTQVPITQQCRAIKHPCGLRSIRQIGHSTVAYKHA